MSDKELKKLSRRELLELLVKKSRENDDLHSRISEMEQLLSDRRIKIENAGSIAEASLQLNNIFETAQQAAEQYLENVRSLSAQQEQICKQMERESEEKAQMLIAETERKCQAMEAETTEKCIRMTADAEKRSSDAWETARSKIRQIIEDQKELQDILNLVSEVSGNS